MLQRKAVLSLGLSLLVTVSACGGTTSIDDGIVDDVLSGESDSASTGEDADATPSEDTQDTSSADAGPDGVDASGSDVVVPTDALDSSASEVADAADAAVPDAADAAVPDAADAAVPDAADATSTGDSAVSCDPSQAGECDDGNPCTDDSCVNGTCQHPGNESPCVLADACVVGGCQNGTCVVAHAKSCDDSDPCTTDACDPATGCTSTAASGGACDDGDACTVGDICTVGKCLGTGALGCDDGDACTDDSCLGGCVHLANAATCSDNDACTQGDTCAQGACVAGSPVTCDDGVSCTVETCIWNQGCVGGPEDSLCSDANGCTSDKCDGQLGCVNTTLDQAACDDNNACSTGEICVGKTCTPPTEAPCDDSDACTDNLCDPVVGCSFPSAVTPCDDGNPCTADYCDSLKGCAVQPAYDGTPCDDGSAATTVDTCSAGKCVGKAVALIPAGTFFMGCVASDTKCATSESPGHIVELDAFYIDTKEVTIAQLQGCVDAGICKFVPGAPGCSGAAPITDTGKTVTCVDWTDASAYCGWVGGRLPTEAEWEKAARGGCELYPVGQCETASSVFPWGNSDPTCSLVNGNDPVSGQQCVGAVTAPGLLANGKSPYGLYDTAGNAAEWVADFYAPDYYLFTPFGGWKNPVGPSSSTTGSHAIRGGGYKGNVYTIRVSSRYFGDGGMNDSGIRCAYDKK